MRSMIFLALAFGAEVALGAASGTIDPATVETEAATAMEVIATVFFAIAVIHTFLVQKFQKFSHRFEANSIRANLFEFLGEVEVVFGIWATIFIAIWAIRFGIGSSARFLEYRVNYTEAIFVFVIMCIAATRPIIYYAGRIIAVLARFVPLPRPIAVFATIMVVGPLLGSFITEPAAMTLTALLLKDLYFDKPMSQRLRYAALGLLFVNVSIGGTLTHFAAPPVIMVAQPWGWDMAYMATHFGWRAVLAVLTGTAATVALFWKELGSIQVGKIGESHGTNSKPPAWLGASHILFLALAVVTAHYDAFVTALFLLFVGWWTVTREFQDELKIRESLLVAYFLGGLVTLGNLQGWWIQPLVSQLEPMALFWGAASLTAFTDNAALTYLGTLVPNLGDAARYALVAGAVVGGGMTVIANAPNPVGYSMLQPTFGQDGISPAKLALGALPYTLLAAFFFLIGSL